MRLSPGFNSIEIPSMVFDFPQCFGDVLRNDQHDHASAAASGGTARVFR